MGRLASQDPSLKRGLLAADAKRVRSTLKDPLLDAALDWLVGTLSAISVQVHFKPIRQSCDGAFDGVSPPFYGLRRRWALYLPLRPASRPQALKGLSHGKCEAHSQVHCSMLSWTGFPRNLRGGIAPLMLSLLKRLSGTPVPSQEHPASQQAKTPENSKPTRHI